MGLQKKDIIYDTIFDPVDMEEEEDKDVDATESTEAQIMTKIVKQVLSESWGNVTLESDSRESLENMGSQNAALACLLNSGLANETSYNETGGQYCNPVWDNVYCWSAAEAGATVNITCQKAFLETQPAYAAQAEGHAWRVCQENGTWLWGNWTDYSECATSYEEFVRLTKEEEELVISTQYILFTGSILSLVCLVTAVSIFSYFKCLRCDRVTILRNLMFALILRYLLLLVITEPFGFRHSRTYRSMDFICKTVLTTYLYSTVASINWMFIQGIYINAKLTTNIFNKKAPFKVYYAIGWVFPILLMASYVTVMEIRHPVKCWRGYSEMEEMWIVLGPMMFALIINFIFLINILRILLTTVQNGGNGAISSDAAQIRKAAKATIFLLPLLGINNLLFVYNPGGNFHKYYVICNSLIGSTQGVFVAVVYCFLSRDVIEALRRLYRRFKVRRSASRVQDRCRDQSIARRVGDRDVSLVVIKERRDKGNNKSVSNSPLGS